MDFKLLLDTRNVLEASRLLVQQHIENLKYMYGEHRMKNRYELRALAEIEELLARINKKLEDYL